MPSHATMIYGGTELADEVDIDIPGPGSPPGMSSSKSSKTSSLRSFNSDDDNGAMADAGHFEEIGLDDDAATLDASHSRDFQQAKSSPNPYSTSFASDLRNKSARHVGPKIHPQTQTRDAARPQPQREITSGRKARPAFPPSRPQFRDTSTHNLSMGVGPEPQRGPLPMRGGPIRSNSTLSVTRRRRSPSPNQSLSPRGPKMPALPRRSSWQTNRERKGVVELEKECDDDDDDDIPEGFILDNVPLSPRPPTERSASRPVSAATSPERSPKERSRNVGNGTPAVAADSGSLKSPTWRSDSSSSSTVKSGASSPTKGRAKSWNVAVADLSAEAKMLTEKLEEHADELDKHGTYQPRPAAKPRVKSALAELPPLRRTNIMIDPLPVSKEKEAVLSRTRPSWLPPKDPAEEKRHIREYQRMMASSIEADKKREAALREKERLKDKAANALMRTWEDDVLKKWDSAIRDPKTRELWWKGVAPRCRGAVWSRAVGNELGLSENSFQAALARAREVEARVVAGKGTTEDERRMAWFDQIQKDVQEQTWVDLKIFQTAGPLHTSLVDVLRAYAMYRSDIGYVPGCNTIAALLLLNLPTPSAAFMTLANILNRSLPLSFFAADAGAKASAYQLVLDGVAQKSPRLHQHLTNPERELEPDEFLATAFTTLFTQNLPLDECTRLWDVYVFERDSVLISAAVTLLLGAEMALLSATTSEEVRSALDVRSQSDRQGKEDEWMAKVQAVAHP